LLDKYHLKATITFDPELIQAQSGSVLTSSGQRVKSLGWEEIAFMRETGHHIIQDKALGGEVLVRSSGYSTDSLLKHLKRENKDWVVLQYSDLKNQPPAKENRIMSGIDQISPHEFEKQVRLMRNANYWIASEESVFQYREERKKASLRINRYGRFQFVTINTPIEYRDF
jgi:hypothetical protein